jgi:hypothetical protein
MDYTSGADRPPLYAPSAGITVGSSSVLKKDIPIPALYFGAKAISVKMI